MSVEPVLQPGSPERILAALLEARAGHSLSPERMWRIETLLQPILRERRLPTLEALVVVLAGGEEPSLIDDVVDLLINHETYFFRDFDLFRDIERVALRLLRERRANHKRLSIWSVGCSTGQEPYSLAMLFAERPDLWQDWDIRIVATDISPSVVRTARAGRYSQFEVQRGLPARAMLEWFEQDGDDWLLRGAIRDRVQFRDHNILTDALPPGPFDLILCRNLLFYLTAQHRADALNRLNGALSNDGLFMLGAFETVIGLPTSFRPDPDARGFYGKGQAAPRATGHLSAR